MKKLCHLKARADGHLGPGPHDSSGPQIKKDQRNNCVYDILVQGPHYNAVKTPLLRAFDISVL